LRIGRRHPGNYGGRSLPDETNSTVTTLPAWPHPRLQNIQLGGNDRIS
jgi:hypothetical protein